MRAIEIHILAMSNSFSSLFKYSKTLYQIHEHTHTHTPMLSHTHIHTNTHKHTHTLVSDFTAALPPLDLNKWILSLVSVVTHTHARTHAHTQTNIHMHTCTPTHTQFTHKRIE